MTRTHLRLNVCVVVVLQEQGRGLGVILAGSDVQGREAHFALGVVLQEQGDHLVMALLEGHSERGETILGFLGESRAEQRRGESMTLDWSCRERSELELEEHGV